MPEFAPEPSRRRAPNFSPQILRNSSLKIELSDSDVLWEMARTGKLKDGYECPRGHERISRDGIIIKFDQETGLTCSLRLNNNLRDAMSSVEFGSGDFERTLSQELGDKTVNVRPESRTVEIGRKRNPDSGYHAQASWPPPNGQVFDREFLYQVSANFVKNSRQFGQELDHALKILQAYLVYGLLQSGKEIPQALLAIKPPADFVRQAKRRSSAKKPETEEEPDGSEVVAASDHFRIEKPRVFLAELEGIPALKRALRHAIAPLLDPILPKGAQELGLPNRTVVIVHGSELGARMKVVEGLASELGAGLCTVNPHIGIPDGFMLLQDVFAFWNKHKQKFLGERVVLHLLEVEQDEFEEMGPSFGPASRLSIDPMYSVLDKLGAWNNTVIAIDVPHDSLAHPSVRSRASAILCTDFALDGAIEVLTNTAARISERTQAALRFEVDYDQAGLALWKENCRTIGDIVDTVEQAIRLRAHGHSPEPRSIDTPFTLGTLLAAWDFIQQTRKLSSE